MNRHDFAQLFKLPMSLMATASAATGYLAFAHAPSWRLLLVAGAVLLLAFAACALNEAQEHRLDARMERTRGRPIPAGKISPFAVVMIAALLGGLALIGLWQSGGWKSASLGALALLWYNGLYTTLKPVSSLASVVGSVVGAIPPAIGWLCAGGTLDGPILSLSFFLLMWQVPHFWLLAMRIGDDSQRAKLPTLARRMGVDSLSRMTFMWTTATAASALLLPIFGLSSSPFVALGLAAGGAWLVVVVWRSLRMRSSSGFRRAFNAINAYAALIMAAVVLDAILAR